MIAVTSAIARMEKKYGKAGGTEQSTRTDRSRKSNENAQRHNRDR